MAWKPKVGDLVRFKGEQRLMRIYALPRIKGEPEFDIEVGSKGGILIRSSDIEVAL